MKIFISGDITIESFVDFTKRLRKAELLAEQIPDEEGSIDITLISPGGDAQVALAYFDRIQASPLKVNIIATGIVASAAVLILAAGHTRRMTKNAWVMVHEESGDISGDVHSIEKEVAHWRRLETQWTKLLASVTVTSAEQWAELHKKETYITPEQCLAYGLIEDII